MPRNAAGESITWRVVVGGIGSVLMLILVFMLTSTANRISTTKDQLEDARRDIVELRGKLALVEAKANGCDGRVTTLEAKIERLKNPRPWETPPLARRNP
jgi:TolA-binding protein